MQKFTWWLAGCSAALVVGCTGTGGDPTLPAGVASGAGQTALGGSIVKDDLAMAASAIYRLEVDPATLSATVTLQASRDAQKNDDVYDLSVDAFMGPGNISVAGVTSDGITLDFNLLVSHPFKAPSNLNGPVTASNRADLGVSMRLLAMLDAPATGNTYFAGTDDLIANTSLMVNQDGYLDPGGMVTTTGLTATAFPFKNVIDETADNRTGLSNGGSVTGNYDPTEGWTRATMGAANDAWTGFGILHQGQSASVTMTVDFVELQTVGFALNLVPVVKYNDPRQGANSSQKRANRLPPASPDFSRFAYRMPHGAFDIADISFLGESGGLIANTLSGTTVKFRVADWDARATETPESDLSQDSQLSNVAIGESGVPTAVEAEIPGLSIALEPIVLSDDDSADGGDAGADSGQPGDELYYSAILSNITTSGQPTNGGPFTGMLRAVDIEANAAFNDSWHFALDESLVPLAADIPEPIGYQSFEVQVSANSLPPTYTSANVPAQVGTGSSTTISVIGLADPESDPLTVEVDWDDDGTYTVHGPFNSPYASPLDITSPITYTYSGSGIDTRDLPIRIKDGANTVDVLPLPTFQVSPCAADNLTFTPYTNPGWIGGTYGGYGPPVNDPIIANIVCAGDIAGLRFPGTHPSRGTVVQELRQFNGSLSPPFVSEFRRVSYTNGAAYMTNFGSNIQGRHVHQIEVDSTNRVFFGLKLTDLTNYAPISTIYPAGTGADADIRYFDYSGATVPWTSVQTINTGGARVVAMSLDKDDNIHMVDTTNVLHKYVKTSAYAEQLTGGYPMDLKTAPIGLTLTGSGAGEKMIHDFVIDWRNGSYYFLVQTREAAGAPGNGYVYRLDCDGYHPTIAGNPNPMQLVLNASALQAIAADISIDQLDGSSQFLTSGRGSAQIMVTSRSTGAPDLQAISSNLTMLMQVDPSRGSGHAIIGQENLLDHVPMDASGSYAANIVWFVPPSPSGWQ